MNNPKIYLGLDIGSKRIGVAWADASVRAAWPLTTLVVDGSEKQQLQTIITEKQVTDLIVGRPRNQSGLDTAQTKAVEAFVAATITPLGLPVHWQDESLTSVAAEQRLDAHAKTYAKSAIDAEAAAIILQDFLEEVPSGG